MVALSHPSKITEEEWERHKSDIISLYFGAARDDSELYSMTALRRKASLLITRAVETETYSFTTA